jgi:hypothetical protein
MRVPGRQDVRLRGLAGRDAGRCLIGSAPTAWPVANIPGTSEPADFGRAAGFVRGLADSPAHTPGRIAGRTGGSIAGGGTE